MTHHFVLISEEPNFTDEELEEVQEILWRGYSPPRYVRHDLETYPPNRVSWMLHLSPKEVKAAEVAWAEERARQEARWAARWEAIAEASKSARQKEYERLYRDKMARRRSEFRCDNCHRMFHSIRDDRQAEQEYRDTFGEAATEERLAVCEACYDRLMQENESSSNQERDTGT